MPVYDFYCKKCDKNFEKFCQHSELDSVRCEECRRKAKRLWTLSGQMGDKNQNFDYRAKKNYERATGERRAAEAVLKGKAPYRAIDDTNRGRRMNFVD